MFRKYVFALVMVTISMVLAAGTVSAGEHGDLGTEFGSSSETDQETSAKSDNFGFGWQYTKPASGFSAKIPVYNDYYIQPVVSFSIDKADNRTEGHYAFGIRGLHQFSERGYLQPYLGVGWGRSKDYESSESKYGYEAFIGVEYKEYFLVPALEISLGSHSKSDGSYHAGTAVNFSVFYYF